MRIFFVAIFIFLGVNLGINLLDSNMTEIINERRETLEKLQHQLWRSTLSTTMQITQEQHQQLIELIEDSVQYYCDENRLSGEMIYTIINAYSEAKLAQLRGEVM